MKLVIVSPRDQPGVWKTKHKAHPMEGTLESKFIHWLPLVSWLHCPPPMHIHTFPGVFMWLLGQWLGSNIPPFYCGILCQGLMGEARNSGPLSSDGGNIHKAIHHRTGREKANHQESRWGIQEGWHLKQAPTMCWHRTTWFLTNQLFFTGSNLCCFLTWARLWYCYCLLATFSFSGNFLD